MKIALVALIFCEIASAAPKFNEALRTLEERNTDLQTQRANVRRSEAELLNSKASFLPAIYATATETQITQKTYSRIQTGFLTGKLNLFHSGADAAGVSESRAGLERERARLNATQLTAETSNLGILIDYVQASMQLQIAKNISRLNEELVTIQDARFKRGLIPLQDSQKALVEKSNSSAEVQDSTGRWEQARAALSAQLGEDSIELIWPWKSFLNPEGAAAWMKKDFDINSVPAWRAAEQDVRSANQGMRSKFRDFLPSLDLEVGYGHPNYEAEHEPGWQTTLSLTIPLLDFKKHAAYRVQVEQESLAKVAQEKTKRDVMAAWLENKAKFEIALQTAAERERSRQLAQSLYEDNQRRLRAGRSNMNDILVDQARLAKAESLAINGWAEAHLAYARFCHSLGMRVNLDKLGCL